MQQQKDSANQDQKQDRIREFLHLMERCGLRSSRTATSSLGIDGSDSQESVTQPNELGNWLLP